LKKYSDIRRDLNVTDATVSNWIKTGVIPAYPNENGFDPDTYDQIIDNIILQYNKLQKRANRLENHSGSVNSTITFSEKSRLIINKLRDIEEVQRFSLNHLIFIISVIILERRYLISCKVGKKRLYLTSDNPTFTGFLNIWMREFENNSVGLYKRLIIFDFPIDEKDFIGAAYESLRSVSDKSLNGAYFTPAHLTQGVCVPVNAKVIDPCSGTGTMLLNILSPEHNPANIILRDIDRTALRIAKVNFVLFFDSAKKLVKTETCDILNPEFVSRKKFDFVISNPPWGAKFSAERKKQLIESFPDLSTNESFSIALLQSMKMLSKTGKLYFILPESIMYVGSHLNIRKKIFSKNNSVRIIHYGKAFKSVMSSVVRLEIEKAGRRNFIVRDGKELEFFNYQIEKNQFRPPFVSNKNEMEILQKILSVPSFTLDGKCSFGLGIVTGNNHKHLLRDLNRINNKTEVIYTGKELNKFKFSDPKFCIDYNPQILQQTAPLKQYRSTKICYRFISDSLITCLDESGKLVLNSINFFIIHSSQLSPKALCTYLNSSVATFIFRKMFNSTKVLKSHIEMLPIPNCIFENAKVLEGLYDKAANGQDVMSEADEVCNAMFLLDS